MGTCVRHCSCQSPLVSLCSPGSVGTPGWWWWWWWKKQARITRKGHDRKTTRQERSRRRFKNGEAGATDQGGGNHGLSPPEVGLGLGREAVQGCGAFGQGSVEDNRLEGKFHAEGASMVPPCGAFVGINLFISPSPVLPVLRRIVSSRPALSSLIL